MTNPKKQELSGYVINYPHIGDANMHGASTINFVKKEHDDIEPRICGLQPITGKDFNERERNRTSDFLESNVRIHHIA